MPLDVDKAFISLGVWGKWQMRQVVWLTLTSFPIAFQLMAIVFVGHEPPFKCRLNGTELYEHVDKCHLRDVSSNVTDECLFGYEYDVPVEVSIVSEWDLVCGRIYLVHLAQVFLLLGQCLGGLVSTYLADRYGRKWVCIICQLICFVFALSIGFVPNIQLFMVLRGVMGAVQPGFGMVSNVMSLELMPVTNRTIVNLFYGLLWALPVTLLTLVGFAFRDTSWRYQQLALSASSAVVIAHIFIVEESVRWLYVNGREKECRHLLTKAAKVNNVPLHVVLDSDQEPVLPTPPGDIQEMDHLNAGDQDPELHDVIVSNCVQEKTSAIQIVADPALRKVTLVVGFAWFVCSLIYYAMFFTSSAMVGNRFINYFLNGVVEIPAHIIVYFFLINIGRRLTLLIFNLVAGLSLIISVALYQAKDAGITGLQTAFSIIGKFGITGAYGTLFIYTPEIYPTNHRSFGVGVCSAAARLGSIISPFCNLLMTDLPWVLGLTFSVLILIVCGLIVLLPETSDKELPQTSAHVQEMCREKLTRKSLFRRYRTYSTKR